MQDVTTQVLSHEGYSAFKYIPYGPIDVCIPYLGTRLLANPIIIQFVELKKTLMCKCSLQLICACF